MAPQVQTLKVLLNNLNLKMHSDDYQQQLLGRRTEKAASTGKSSLVSPIICNVSLRPKAFSILEDLCLLFSIVRLSRGA